MVAGGIGQTPFLAGREYWDCRRYGDPPRTVPPAAKVTLCYGARRPILGRRRGFPAAGRRGADQHRRRQPRPSRAGHRRPASSVGDNRTAPRRIVCLRPRADDGGGRQLAAAHAVPCQVSLGNADGLRHRHLLHLRGQGERRRRLGLQAHLRRRPRLRRREDRMVGRANVPGRFAKAKT